mgnify:CR=1 FL=1
MAGQPIGEDGFWVVNEADAIEVVVLFDIQVGEQIGGWDWFV